MMEGNNKESISLDDSTNLVNFATALNDATANQDSLISFYQDWADQYDNILLTVGYSLHDYVVQFLLQIIVEDEDVNESSSIIDFCAGTGMVGAALRAKGFTGHIDALDGSTAMLEKLKKRKVYERMFCQILEKTTTLPEELTVGFYDISIVCSAMIPGHVNYDCLEHVVNATKVGGLIICTLRRLLLDNHLEYMIGFEREAFRLEKLGVLQLVDNKFIRNYRSGVTKFTKSKNVMAILVCYKKLKNVSVDK